MWKESFVPSSTVPEPKKTPSLFDHLRGALSGFFVGVALGLLAGFPTGFVLLRFPPIAKAFPDIGGLFFILIFLPLGLGIFFAILGFFYASTNKLARNLAKFAAITVVLFIIGSFIFYLNEQKLTSNLLSSVPGLGAKNVPTTKTDLSNLQNQVTFKILAPGYLPSGIKPRAGAGAIEYPLEKLQKDCRSIDLIYDSNAGIVGITEALSELPKNVQCPREPLVSSVANSMRKDYTSLKNALENNSPIPDNYADKKVEIIKLEENQGIMIKRKGQGLKKDQLIVEKVLLVRENTVVRIDVEGTISEVETVKMANSMK